MFNTLSIKSNVAQYVWVCIIVHTVYPLAAPDRTDMYGGPLLLISQPPIQLQPCKHLCSLLEDCMQ